MHFYARYSFNMETKPSKNLSLVKLQFLLIWPLGCVATQPREFKKETHKRVVRIQKLDSSLQRG